ncbi:hypothetical protein ACFFX0_10405 [Citricoccus parietis]|uniref:Uncharacterized protein n=1 Tax=Citricoccus parietis TaxID=592307 RepID=A0ABV5FY41_9MICC
MAGLRVEEGAGTAAGAPAAVLPFLHDRVPALDARGVERRGDQPGAQPAQSGLRGQHVTHLLLMQHGGWNGGVQRSEQSGHASLCGDGPGGDNRQRPKWRARSTASAALEAPSLAYRLRIWPLMVFSER